MKTDKTIEKTTIQIDKDLLKLFTEYCRNRGLQRQTAIENLFREKLKKMKVKK